MPAPDATISADHFRQILEVSRMLAVTTELDALLLRIAEAAAALLDCERASIFLHDPKTDELCTRVALQSREIRVPSAAGIVGHVFRNNTVVHVPRPYDDARFNPEPDRRAGFVTRNLLTAPMVDLGRRPIGVIQAVNNRAAHGFSTVHESLIQLLADQAGVAIQRYHLQQEALAAQYMRHEMELARRVQQAMLPKAAPRIDGLEAVGWTRAASQTGGDCFDLWKTADGRLGVFVGDATGHGLAPALVVSQTRTLVRGMCELGPDPHDLLACANARLSEDLAPGTFVTAFLALISTDGTMHWSSAGHGPVLVRDGPDAPLRELEPPAPPLGVVPELGHVRVEPVTLRPGGMLAVISDGVFDARNAAGELYETPRVHALLDGMRAAAPQAVLDALRSEMVRWQGREEPQDDQTVVFVKKV